MQVALAFQGLLNKLWSTEGSEAISPFNLQREIGRIKVFHLTWI